MPDLDPRDAQPCYDPGVDPDAYVALAENRTALAACRRKHQNVVEFYRDVRDDLATETE